MFDFVQKLKNKEMIRKIENVFDKYGYSPALIVGQDFPDNLLMFESEFHSIGTSMFCHPGDVFWNNPMYRMLGSTEIRTLLGDDYVDSVEEPYYQLRSLIANECSCKEEIFPVYQKILKPELRHGLVRFMYRQEHYKKDTKVKSKYGNYILNYSPELTFISDPPESADAFAEVCADYCAGDKPCCVMKVYIGREIKEEEVPDISSMMREVMSIINNYSIAEYKKKRNNSEYQYRNDWNPADF